MAKKKAAKDKPVKVKKEKKAPKVKGARDPRHEEIKIEGTSADYWSALSYLNRITQHPVVKKALAGGKKAAEAVQKKAIDFTQVMGQIPQWLAMIQMIQQLIASFRPAPKPPVVVNPPQPGPGPVSPPIPGEPPVPVAPTTTRRITSLTSHYLGAEGYRPRDKNNPDAGGDHFPVQWRAGVDVAGAGYRLHGDSTPKDAANVAFYNEDVGKFPDLFAKDPTRVTRDATGKFTCTESNNRTEFYVRWDGQEYGPQGDMAPGTPFDGQPMALTSETDDASFTPVWVVPTDLDPGSGAHKFQWRQVYIAPDGRRVEGDWSTEVTVHAWMFS
jgi:hypothetical protein